MILPKNLHTTIMQNLFGVCKVQKLEHKKNIYVKINSLFQGLSFH